MWKMIFLTLLVKCVCYTNPFLIDFSEKTDLTHDDLIEIQSKLRQIDIDQLVDLYWQTNPTSDRSELYGRMRVGLRSTLIAPEKGYFPKTILKKIGKGGMNCVVTYATFDKMYPELAESIADALQKTGFNGYFYCRIGGYPTPTGQETKYIGVPYAFKIFMLQEALLKGFQAVLWIDSSFLPLNNPKPIFDHIHRYGAFFYVAEVNLSALNHLLLPVVHESLYQLYQKTTADAHIIWCVFGFQKMYPQTQQFLDGYFRAVEMGYPFISSIPEMAVIPIVVSTLNYNPQVFTTNDYQLRRIANPNRERDETCYFWYREH